MTIEAEVKTYIGGDTALAAVIGTNLRPWPLGADPVLPAVRYFIVDSPTTPDFRGKTHERRPRIQLTVWAETPAERASVGELVAAAAAKLPGYSEVVDEGRDSVDGPTGLYRRDVDVKVLR